MTPINSTTHQINWRMMPFPASNTHMPVTLDNLRAPPNAAGRATQLTAGPPPGDPNKHAQPKKRANICIATLNVNGASAPTQNMNHINKWSIINSTIRTERIAILALQETHLDEERLEDINRCFGKNFDIINSSTPGSPRTTAGIAIILNKALIAPTSVQTYTQQQERAIMMKIKWLETEELTIMNVYAPNKRGEHLAFWAQLELERRQKCLAKPDFVLGDFNVTEDRIDRSPPQENGRNATDALRDIRVTWDIQDQWRHDNPSEWVFTHRHTKDGKHKYA